jgi:NADH pyrophosphatase NudC (nudix superfamily)
LFFEIRGEKIQKLIGFPDRPFPSNLMIGCFGLVAADAGSIDLELDNELEDARWFPKDLVLETL